MNENNESRRKVLKKQYSRSWYVEKGYLICKIKSLVKKFNIDVDNLNFCINYIDKSSQELEYMLKNLNMYIVMNDGYSQKKPI
jgi:hypothetical protein